MMVSRKFLEVVPLILLFCIFTGILIFHWFLGYGTDLDYWMAVIGGLICTRTLLMAKYISGVLTLWCCRSVWVLVWQITLTFGIWIFGLSLCVLTAWAKWSRYHWLHDLLPNTDQFDEAGYLTEFLGLSKSLPYWKYVMDCHWQR